MRTLRSLAKRCGGLLLTALIMGLPAGGDTLEGPAATIRRSCEALLQNDPEAVRATLAPDYQYDGLNAEQLSNQFEGPLMLHYRSVACRTEAMTRAGNRVTAIVSLLFRANLNLEFVGLGRPLVNGSARMVLELEPRGGEWRVTASRLVQAAYAAPGRSAPHIFDYRVNGRTALTVAPGATLDVEGQSYGGARLFLFIGAKTASARLDPEFVSRWRTPLTAPTTPGRYLLHALCLSADLLALEHLTIPVTVKD